MYPEVNGFRLPYEVSAAWSDIVHTATISSSILHWEKYDVVAGYPRDPLEIIFLCVLSWCACPCFPVKFEQCSPSLDTPACCLFHHGSLWPLPHTVSIPPAKNRSGSSHWPLHRVKPSPSTSGWGTDKCWVYAQPGQSKGWYFLMLVEKSHWTAQPYNSYLYNSNV